MRQGVRAGLARGALAAFVPLLQDYGGPGKTWRTEHGPKHSHARCGGLGFTDRFIGGRFESAG
jgi:hypothetical protein